MTNAIGKVFISYRRDDAKYQARMIYGAIRGVLPREAIFMDIDSIPLGLDFVEVLKGWVNKCDTLLALIGPGWADARDPNTMRRRLDNQDDFVRIEIREALKRRIPVVPVLLDGAAMPGSMELPDDLKTLSTRQAEFINFRSFDSDVERLMRKLQIKREEAKRYERMIAPSVNQHESAQHRLSDHVEKKERFATKTTTVSTPIRRTELASPVEERVVKVRSTLGWIDVLFFGLLLTAAVCRIIFVGWADTGNAWKLFRWLFWTLDFLGGVLWCPPFRLKPWARGASVMIFLTSGFLDIDLINQGAAGYYYPMPGTIMKGIGFLLFDIFAVMYAVFYLRKSTR